MYQIFSRKVSDVKKKLMYETQKNQRLEVDFTAR